MANEEKKRSLLKPSTALNRFNPPPGTVMGIAPPPRPRVRYGFRVGDLGLLIGPDTVSELLELVPIYPIPHTPPWLSGLINLRGNLVPVFDIKKRLELTEAGQEKRRILVLDRADKAIAVLIDGLPQTPDLSRPLTRLPPLPRMLRAFVSKAYLKDKKLWLEFEHQGFFHALAGEIAPST